MNKKLLVIYYHEVVPVGQGYSYQKIDIDKFDQQMRYLHEHGYQSLLFSELAKPLPDKAIIVSFDDGFKTVYQNAMPIMQKYGIKGNIYLPTKYIDQDTRFMTWNMVREMCSTGQFEMQAHTHCHTDIRTLNPDSIMDEIRQSDTLLEMHLGMKPEAFCIPFGTFDRASIKLLRKQRRYRYILGSYYGRKSEKRLSSTVLPRIGISNDDTVEIFKKKLCGGFDWKGPLQRIRLSLHNLKKDRITKYEY